MVRSAGLKSAPKKSVHKKGYRPLLDPKGTENLVESTFDGAAVFIDSRWELGESEKKELSKSLYGIFEAFPVKIEDNPLVLQRVMALFGFILTIIAICSENDRFKKTLEGNNDGIISKIGKKQKRVATGNGTAGATEG